MDRFLVMKKNHVESLLLTFYSKINNIVNNISP